MLTPTCYIYICDANKKTLKLKRTFKELLDDAFLHKDLHHYTDTKADFDFFFNLFGKRQWHVFLLIGRLMVTKGYGSPPSLAPGQNYSSGWLTVRKHHLGVAGDTFIEPVKLTKAMS